ncbi:MAG TPA: exonuclease [Lachnospiraceae bacterium]|nr:exonuclease [Lachnospiraceae bacterium]
MKIIRSEVSITEPAFGREISLFEEPEKLLLLDIETTGLSRERSAIYLIGFGHLSGNNIKTVQFFAEHPAEEPVILREGLSFAKSFDILLHYNGKHFDLPFLEYKALKYGTDYPLKKLREFDIYAAIRPLKKLLGLTSLRQREVEGFLNAAGDDPYTGRELIRVYHDYVKAPSDELLSPLLYHNREDILGMLNILPMLRYREILSMTPGYLGHRINSYPGFDGSQKEELIIELSHSLRLPADFRSLNGSVFISFEENRVLIRVPSVQLTLKHFYDNFRDYYYLPFEDTCIHKSAAAGVDKEYREPARRETCYTKASGLFVPGCKTPGFTLFRPEYDSMDEYISLSELNKKEALLSYGTALLKELIDKRT